ncbi:MAG: hypothetical protein NT079_03740 [Candidatus Omnitrophica bacterium]|nr:hypothetical protein [Candidatus Omnitrophota bacterium]
MRKGSFLIIVLFALFCVNVSLAHAMNSAPDKATKAKTVDVNKDGKPDVTYYSEDGKNVTKIEADTNYDGKTDVVVHANDGKFQSAQIDTDKNGSLDKEITDAAQFKAWVNENRPDFKESLTDSWRLGPPDFLKREEYR